MSESTDADQRDGRAGVSRRAVVKGAAWSVPVVAAAVALPLAAASVAESTLAWGPSNGPLLSVGLLNGGATGGGLVTVNALPSGANFFRISNPTAGAVEGPLTGHVSVKWTSGVPLANVKGYGVYAVDGSAAAVAGRTETRRTLLGLVGTYETEQNITISRNIAGSSSVDVPITWGLTNGGGLGVSVLVNFTATLTLFDKNGVQIGDAVATPLQVPVGLNIL
ncbi:hypothetical protein [Microbacterium sp. NPDC057650]|uniref:hypothetical protein n=1 Tax=unclassified Microbacterium TaxID=2609290 RepID=UPI00366F98EE